jgi:hypothetical protein
MRRGARSVLKWFAALYVVLIVVQVFLAGEGIFVSIVLPFLAFFQMILAGLGRWGGAFHPVNAILLLGLFGWLFSTLRQEQPQEAVAPVAVPAD